MAQDAHFTTIASLTPSLEAIARLSQEEQATQMRNLVSKLRQEAKELTDENEDMRGVIKDLENEIVKTDEGLVGMSYGTFVYEDKILKEKVKRIMNPNLNKLVQVFYTNDNPTKSTQTKTLAAVLIEFAEEAKKKRQLQEKDDVTIRAREKRGTWGSRGEGPIDFSSLAMLSFIVLFLAFLAVSGFATLTLFSIV